MGHSTEKGGNEKATVLGIIRGDSTGKLEGLPSSKFQVENVCSKVVRVYSGDTVLGTEDRDFQEIEREYE